MLTSWQRPCGAGRSSITSSGRASSGRVHADLTPRRDRTGGCTTRRSARRTTCTWSCGGAATLAVRSRKSWTVDHLCEIGLCARPDHLDERPVTRGENTRRRHQRKARSADTETVPADGQSATVQTFAIALFERIDRTQFKARTVTLDELATLLTRFEVLPDKHLGQCWSPTTYSRGAKTAEERRRRVGQRLVFDCDRVGPDPQATRWACTGSATRRTRTPRWRHGGAS